MPEASIDGVVYVELAIREWQQPCLRMCKFASPRVCCGGHFGVTGVACHILCGEPQCWDKAIPPPQ